MSIRVRAESSLRDERGREFEIVRIEEPEAGLLAFLAIEAGAAGRPGFGGLRRAVYADEHAARADALALASGMALKLRCAEMPAVGAKAVMMDHPDLDRRRAYEAIGAFVGGFEGRYVCGPDLGTTEADLDLLRAQTRHVNAAANAPGPSTARGVAAALMAALEFEPQDATVLIEGLGSVGAALARRLVDADLSVVGFDPRQEAGRDLARELEAKARFRVSEEPLREVAGVYAPCALGRTLDARALERWRGRLVCGSANDQRAPGMAPADLAKADILWVPDFVANPGAVVEGVLVAAGRPADVPRALDAIGIRTSAILAEAARTGRTPYEVAVERAESRR